MMSTAGDVLAFTSVSTETVSGFTDGNGQANASYKVGEDAFLWVVPPPPALTVTVAGNGSVISYVTNLGPVSASSVVATFVPLSGETVMLAPGCAKGKGKRSASTTPDNVPGNNTAVVQFSIGQ